jgi:hypothetical protein
MTIKPMPFVAIIAMGLLGGLPLGAATLSSSDSRETLVTQESLGHLSIGGVFEVMKRDMQYDGGGKTKLEARNYYGYAGYDFWRWITVFGTLGGTQAKSAESDTLGDAKLKWSAGMNLKLWQYEIADPSWIAGRASIRAIGEFSQYQSGNTDTTKLKWREISACVTLNYEVFVKGIDNTGSYPYSLLLYIGPAYSTIDGKQETIDQSVDFSEAHNFGIAAGAEVFASHNLSIGGQLQYYFDEPTFSASLVYNF